MDLISVNDALSNFCLCHKKLETACSELVLVGFVRVDL